MSDDYDFGFTMVDEDDLEVSTATQQPVQAEIPSDQIDAIMDKLEQLDARILQPITQVLLTNTALSWSRTWR